MDEPLSAWDWGKRLRNATQIRINLFLVNRAQASEAAALKPEAHLNSTQETSTLRPDIVKARHVADSCHSGGYNKRLCGICSPALSQGHGSFEK